MSLSVCDFWETLRVASMTPPEMAQLRATNYDFAACGVELLHHALCRWDVRGVQLLYDYGARAPRLLDNWLVEACVHVTHGDMGGVSLWKGIERHAEMSAHGLAMARVLLQCGADALGTCVLSSPLAVLWRHMCCQESAAARDQLSGWLEARHSAAFLRGAGAFVLAPDVLPEHVRVVLQARVL